MPVYWLDSQVIWAEGLDIEQTDQHYPKWKTKTKTWTKHDVTYFILYCDKNKKKTKTKQKTIKKQKTEKKKNQTLTLWLRQLV